MKKIILCLFSLLLLVPFAALASRLTDLNTVDNAMYVYEDFASSNNNFGVKAKICSEGGANLVSNLEEDDTANRYQGNSCLRAEIDFVGESWGGWLFTTGYLPEGAQEPVLNFGEHPDSGLDLRKAEKLTFMAKGAKGGEKVECFMGGLGWSSETGKATAPYPDSTQKISLGVITLTDRYTAYTLDLKDRDLSYLSCGFGFVASGRYNTEKITFYLDDIQYVFPEEKAPAREFPWAIVVPIAVALIGAAATITVALIKKKQG